MQGISLKHTCVQGSLSQQSVFFLYVCIICSSCSVHSLYVCIHSVFMPASSVCIAGLIPIVWASPVLLAAVPSAQAGACCWVPGLLGPWGAPGPLGLWAPWASGLLGSWALGPQGLWAPRPLDPQD